MASGGGQTEEKGGGRESGRTSEMSAEALVFPGFFFVSAALFFRPSPVKGRVQEKERAICVRARCSQLPAGPTPDLSLSLLLTLSLFLVSLIFSTYFSFFFPVFFCFLTLREAEKNGAIQFSSPPFGQGG